MAQGYIDFATAKQLVAERTPLLEPRLYELAILGGLVLAQGVKASVASPSVNASTKDGYAVRSADLAQASEQNPVRLSIVGSVVAGEKPTTSVARSQAMRITTGAPLPPGADCVLPSELSRLEGDEVFCLSSSEVSRNVLAKGSDVDQGQEVASANAVLTPERVGLLAASGCSEALAYPRPRVGLLATGREVVAPGEPLPQGAVFASNLVTLATWLSLHRMEHQSRVVDDSRTDIKDAARDLLAVSDALLISGGAWTSERDLVVSTLDDMGFEMAFRRVRMGPGKGVAFGLVQGKPVFCLPGGPPSNEMAFLQLALPCLLRMTGFRNPGLPTVTARLRSELSGQEDWTQFWHGRLETSQGENWFDPLPLRGRLRAMADSDGIVSLPTGQTILKAGEPVTIQRLAAAVA